MNLLRIEEAWSKIAALAAPLPIDARPLEQAAGSVVAEAVAAPVALPPFDNSAMDGYALRAADTVGASAEQPVVLPVIGEVAAGGWRQEGLASGRAVQIMTGAALPPEADAVLMLEAGRLRNGAVEIRESVPAGKHVRRRGEDVQQHQVLVAPGARLNAQRLGLLAACGIAQVRVHRQPTVSMLATGSELVAAGVPLAPGQIYDSNRIVLRRLLGRAGCVVADLGVAPDDADAIAARIREGLAADVLLISGGVSVGSRDHVKPVLRELGVETVFWGVDMKPGKPLFCGRRGTAWVFGLPGNPISCVVGFLVFVEPLIRRLQGDVAALPGYVRAKLTHAVHKHDGRRWLMTARLDTSLDGTRLVTPTVQQGSAMMRALSQANAFLVVPEERTEVPSGELVDVLPIDGS